MYIKRIYDIENYRNLSGLDFELDKEITYIVAENNTGKTNFLDLMDIIFNKFSFKQEDFCDCENQISLKLILELTDNEIGYFDDLFSLESKNEICIRILQETPEDRIEYVHDTTDEIIPLRKFKTINFLYYESGRNPNKELSFNTNIGVGKVLKFLIQKYMKDKEVDQYGFINKANIESLIKDTEESLNKIEYFNNFDLKLYLDTDKDEIVNKILNLGDLENRTLMDLGDGVKYSLLINLTILEYIIELKYGKYKRYYDEIIVDIDDKKLIPLFIALDEPEIHLHPYMQRALIKYILKLIRNQDEKFLELLKNLFDIDGIYGQVIVSTHSPNIIFNKYDQIIRMYKDNNTINVRSGKSFNLEEEYEKHILRIFSDIKEAMFSKGIIFVEGQSELGAILEFCERLEIDIDKESIGVISLDGADSIVKCMEILSKYDIKSIAIIDRDKYDNYKDINNIFFTNLMDFEEDIYDSFKFKDYMMFIKEFNPQNISCFIGGLRAINVEFNPQNFVHDLDDIEITKEQSDELKERYKETVLQYLKSNKNAVTGRELAKYVTEIPLSYKYAIEKIRGMVKNNGVN